MSERRNGDDISYEVGYAKPPKDHRFRKGQSGNPRGRPPRNNQPPEPSLGEIKRAQKTIQEEMYRDVTVREGERIEQMPLLKAIVRSMGQQAVKGNKFSQRKLLDLIVAAEKDEYDLHAEYLQVAIAYKTSVEREIEKHKEQGMDPPEYYPHPDNIEIDLTTGRVHITGPMTKEEKET